jgi:hypothetical protein
MPTPLRRPSDLTAILTGLRYELDRLALVVAMAIWTLIAWGVFTRGATLPHARVAVVAFPLALLAVALLSGGRLRVEFGAAAAWGLLVSVALWLVPMTETDPKVAFAALALVVVAVFSGRYPAAAVVAAFALTGILGSLQAFAGVNAGSGLDLILGGLLIALLIRLASSERTHHYLLWPTVLAILIYVLLTALEIFTAASTTLGFLSFRISTWYMLAIPLLAYAAWPRETYQRIARGFVLGTLVIAGYATLRWLIGPADAERTLATHAAGGINIINGQLRTVGTFGTGHELSLWMGTMGPFCFALAFASRGRWRMIGMSATILCVFAALASEARGPLVGMAVGCVIVAGLYAFARAFPATGATALVVTAGLILAGGASFALTGGGLGGSSRYANIVHPTRDPAFIARQHKWTDALMDIDQHPFGQGLGTAGQVQEQAGQYFTVASFNLDNSYLKVAWEQGLAVMVFLATALVLLAIRLGGASVAALDPARAALGIGATGTLVSMLISFLTGIYVETPAVLVGWMIVGLGLSGFVAVPVEEDAPGRDTPPMALAGRRKLVSDVP